MVRLLKQREYNELIEATQRILKLGQRDFRVTDLNLFSKNPKYSLCDIVLKINVVYDIEHLFNMWINISRQEPIFIFKNNGCSVSLSCHLQVPVKSETVTSIRETNVLNVNENLIVCLADFETIKPSSQGVITKCIIRKNKDLVFVVEFISYGPENERDYEALLKMIYTKKKNSHTPDIQEKTYKCVKMGERRHIPQKVKKMTRNDNSLPLMHQDNKRHVVAVMRSFWFRDYIVLLLLMIVIVGYVVYLGLFKTNYSTAMRT